MERAGGSHEGVGGLLQIPCRPASRTGVTPGQEYPPAHIQNRAQGGPCPKFLGTYGWLTFPGGEQVDHLQREPRPLAI